MSTICLSGTKRTTQKVGNSNYDAVMRVGKLSATYYCNWKYKSINFDKYMYNLGTHGVTQVSDNLIRSNYYLIAVQLSVDYTHTNPIKLANHTKQFASTPSHEGISW